MNTLKACQLSLLDLFAVVTAFLKLRNGIMRTILASCLLMVAVVAFGQCPCFTAAAPGSMKVSVGGTTVILPQVAANQWQKIVGAVRWKVRGVCPRIGVAANEMQFIIEGDIGGEVIDAGVSVEAAAPYDASVPRAVIMQKSKLTATLTPM